MSFPAAIFIDTCILDSQHYDFSSTQLKALADAAKDKGLKLVLPAPTKLEIEKHVKEMARLAVSALKKARDQNPLLQRLKTLPLRKELVGTAQQIEKGVTDDWASFCKLFTLKELDYSGVDLNEVMGWYKWERAPFGPGAKQKEFPDAIAFASLLSYAKASKDILAIVSSDKDFAAACIDHINIQHFSSLADLVSALLAKDDHHKAAETLVESADDQIESKITEAFPELNFDHASDPNGGGYVDNVEVESIRVTRAAIISIGHRQFTAAYSAEVQFSANVEYDDPDSWVSGERGDPVMYLHRCKGVVSDEIRVSGSIRFTTDSEWSKIEAATGFVLDQEHIEVETTAPQEDDYYDPDEYQ